MIKRSWVPEKALGSRFPGAATRLDLSGPGFSWSLILGHKAATNVQDLVGGVCDPKISLTDIAERKGVLVKFPF